MPFKQYVLGRGKVHFARFLPDTQTPDGFRYIGNTPEFSLNIESEELDHYDSDEGIREKDDSVPLEVNRTGSLVTDNIDPENVALFFFGRTVPVSQTIVAPQTVTLTDIKVGHSYKLGATASNPTGFFGINATGFAAVRNPGAVPLVLGIDYQIDLNNGIMTFLESSTVAIALADIDVTFAVRASNRTRVLSGSVAVEGAMMYVTKNPKGADSMFYLPYVKVTPNGDYALKGDDWQMIPMSLEVLKPTGLEAIYRDGIPVYA